MVITHRNVLANLVPIETEIAKYRRWARPVLPLRLLNLLPLSHMFGQALAAFIPPMLPATVIFLRGQHPADVVAAIRSRRVSVLVCVPKMLDLLRGRVCRVVAGANDPPRPGRWPWRWWQYRRLHRHFRAVVLERRRRRRAARRRVGGVLGGAGVRGDPGLRPDRDGTNRDALASVQDPRRIGGDAHCRRRSGRCARRRDPGPWRERHARLLRRVRCCHRRRLAAHRRPGRDRRGRTGLHPRPQEGRDRRRRRHQGVPRGCRARRPGPGQRARTPRPSASRPTRRWANGCTWCWRWIRASIPTASSARPMRAWSRIRRSTSHISGRSRRCRAPRAPAS